MIKKSFILFILLAILITPTMATRAQDGLEVVNTDVLENAEEVQPLPGESEAKRFVKGVPGFLKNLYTDIVAKLELFRTKSLVSIQAGKEKTELRIEENSRQKELDILVETGELKKSTRFIEPWEYVKLSVLTGIEAVLEKAFIFYGIIIILIIILLVRIF